MNLNHLPILGGLLAYMLCSSLTAWGQRYTISGYMSDAANGENLINATIYETKSQKGVLTNTYGFFSLTLDAGEVALVCSHAGFSEQTISFNLQADTSLNINLAYLALDEVEIVAQNQDRQVDKTQMSTVDIPIDQIKKLPALFGEVDVIKALQYMPGVQSGNEGTSGLYVRGGGPDQNLILLDGVPLYYVSHLGGFFSVFNADALSSVQLYKGAFPARFGGRLSSVLDIRMKEGNLNKFEGEGSVGLISSKLSLQGPIVKGKSSFIISGRRTYIDLFTRPLSSIISSASTGGEERVSIGYYFYDLNGKANYIFSDRDRLFFSFYLGQDKFSGTGRYRYDFAGESGEEKFKLGLGWGNRLGALRWNHIWSDKLFSNLTATYTRYGLDIGAGASATYTTPDTTTTESFDLTSVSQIEDWGLRLDFDYYPSPAHEVKFGIQTTLHKFEPSTLGISSQGPETSIDTSLVSAIDRPLESNLYLEDNIKIGRRFSANVGVHAAHYLLDQVSTFSVQPRVAARLSILDNLSVKASYSTMTQFIHLLTNSGVGLPIDLWVPATERVPSQNAWQVAGGISASLFDDRFDFSIEGYYKEMTGLITFKEGNNFFLGGVQGDTWENTVETGGTGEAYGVELLLQKRRGQTTGWIGYTLAWNWRQFDNINKGIRFPYKYDRRHDISVVVNHKFNDHISVAATWVYGTGNAITLPTAGFSAISEPNVSIISEPLFRNFYYDLFSSITPFARGVELFENGRNGFRMQAYHRLDLGINLTKEKKWGQRTWALGVYNAYSRLNPYVYYFQDVYQYNQATQTYDSERQLRKLSLFPIIPSFSYQFKF